MTAAALTRTSATSLERNPVALYLSSKSAGSVPALRSALELVAHRFLEVAGSCGDPQCVGGVHREVESTPVGKKPGKYYEYPCPGPVFLPILEVAWHGLRHVHVQGLRQWMVQRGFAPAYCNKVLSAVFGVLKACRRLKLIGVDDLDEVLAVGQVTGSREGSGRCLTKAEVRKLFAAAEKQAPILAARDVAMLALLRMGLRRAEVVGLDLDSLRGKDVRVVGKGNKERVVPLAPGALNALAAWLLVRGPGAGRGSVAAPLLLALTPSGTITDRRMTSDNVPQRLLQLRTAAGVAKFSAHDLRRSFVSELIDAGEDLVTVQRLAGHAQVTTTQRYDRRGLERARQAVKKIEVPIETPPKRRKR